MRITFMYTLKPRHSEQVCQTFFVHYIEEFTTYFKGNMLSKSSKWEVGLVHYIEVCYIKVRVYLKVAKRGSNFLRKFAVPRQEN